MSRVLIMSSWTAVGDVGLSIAAPLLQSLGHIVTQLPTVILSNHLGWPHHAGRPVPPEQLSAMIDAIAANGWLHDHDALLTGYLPTVSHVTLARDLLVRLRRGVASPLVVVDPILGDDPRGPLRRRAGSRRHPRPAGATSRRHHPQPVRAFMVVRRASRHHGGRCCVCTRDRAPIENAGARHVTPDPGWRHRGRGDRIRGQGRAVSNPSYRARAARRRRRFLRTGGCRPDGRCRTRPPLGARPGQCRQGPPCDRRVGPRGERPRRSRSGPVPVAPEN